MNGKEYFEAALRTAPISVEQHCNQVTRMVFIELLDDGITIPKGRAGTLDIVHGILGIAGEASELMRLLENGYLTNSTPSEKSEILKELGDIWWYVAPLLRGLEHVGRPADFEGLRNGAAAKAMDLYLVPKGINGRPGKPKGLSLAVDQITEPLKKWIFYGKQIDLNKLIAAVENLLCATIVIAHHINVSSEEIMESNIRKLKARYPERFDEDAATAKADEQS